MAAAGFFVSRCKGALAPAEKSWATPLQEGERDSIGSSQEGRRELADHQQFRRDKWG